MCWPQIPWMYAVSTLLSVLSAGVYAQQLHPAGAPSAPAAQREQVWMAVADKQLDSLRGGFDLGGGLMVSLGIQQATYINGQLVTQTSIPLQQLNQLTADQAAVLRERLNTLTVVQNGAGNRMGAATGAAQGGPTVLQVPGAGPGTVIQNTLNGQHIQHMTTIDATSNAMGLMRSGQWQQTLRDSMGNVGAMR